MRAISAGGGGSDRIEAEHQRRPVARRRSHVRKVEARGASSAKSITSRRSASTWARRRVDRAVGEHPAVADDDHALGEGLDVVHVVRRQQHGNAALAIGRLNELAHRKLGRRVQPDGRLVQKQDARARGAARPRSRRACAGRARVGARAGRGARRGKHRHQLVARARIARRGRPGRCRAAARSRRRRADPTRAACAGRTRRRCAPRGGCGRRRARGRRPRRVRRRVEGCRRGS